MQLNDEDIVWIERHNFNSSKEQAKAKKDMDFIAKVLKATLDQLQIVKADYQHKDAPQWKIICIERAIKRLTG